MILCYVAGPFRSATHWGIAENIRRAERLALEVWKLGAACICPHLNTAHFQNELPDEVWLQGDLEMIKRCDAILMTPDWQLSKGAIAEYHYAIAHNVLVFFTVGDLRMWLQCRPS